ncbi:zinc finger MYM-type protein 1-like [Acropora palmata]|uniref:zinc finger MYM-type protein 1-like n=1 Tax=Acropora palmata TaxID=6131 RepID=UPI003DA0D823
MQTTKSTAEQPRSPTVHIQQLEAEHSASPGQSLTDNLHITEPFQPTNFNFPKKTFGKQNRSFQSKWFNDFPWLHYNEQSDSVLCFICAQQNQKLNLRAARNKEWVFISQGFSNWKKALVRFKEHQVSECHKLAMEYQISIPNTCGNVIQMSNDAAKKTMATNRFCLLKIIECLQYLARQAMPMQGDTDEECNFIQLLKLRGKDQPVLLKWLERKDDKYTSHEIQNEIISIMANNVIRDLVADIRVEFFAIIADEYTDVSNKEQLTICIRWIDKGLEVHEDFLGFFNIPDTGAETIVSVIKAVLLKLQLSLAYCRGQCYDGASNMLGHKTGVAKRIQDVQPKAHPTHCHGHSLSLSVKDTVRNCKLLLNTMDTAKDIVTLIKFSPKRECLLGDIKENLDEEHAAGGIIALCPTRWTVRASCFQRIIDNYSALLQEWIVCLDQKLQADVRGRVIGCKAQMNTSDFFFGLNLGERLFSHTDNLSKTLQKTKMSAVSGQRVANEGRRIHLFR